MVNVTSFSLPSTYLVSNKLNIPNPTLVTSFQFNVSLLRSLLSNGSYESVSGSSITLVYSDCNFCGNYTEISTTRALSEADFYQGSTNWPSNNAQLTLNAELPVNKTTGFLMVKHVYFDSNQNKTLTEYISNATIGVQVSSNYISSATLTKISSMGFATDGITSGNDYYLVEDDIMLSKTYVNGYSSSTPPISLSNDNINISIDQSVWANSNWDNAMYYAVIAWNSQANSNVKINVVKKVAGGNFALPNTIDIEMKQSSDPVKVPVISRFTVNDGKPGHQILFNPNFKYAGSNLTVSMAQATWNLVQAIGHCLGIKHATGTGSQSSVMLRGTAASSYNNNLSSVYDSQVLGLKFPVNSSSQVEPFISGINSLGAYESADYLISYWEVGITYTWKAIGINGTVYNEDYNPATGSRLPEVYFPAGNYRIQCTISGGKYSTPATVTKDILVQ